MGYCIELDTVDFRIEPAQQEACLAAMKGMFGREDELGARGGSFGPDGNQVWYAWMNGAKPDQWTTCADALNEWRYASYVEAASGDMVMDHFDGEKLGDEEKLWDVIAPFVKAGSHIDMRGEDGDHWQWAFDGKNVHDNPVYGLTDDYNEAVEQAMEGTHES